MRRNWMMGLAFALMLAFMPAAGYSQVGSGATDAPKNYRAKGAERFKAVFLEKLAEELALDQTTVDKLGQSFDSYKDQARGLRQEGKALKTKLREAVAGGAADSEIEAIFTETEAYRERHRQLRASHQAEIQQILGTQGYAKYVLFKQDLRHKMRHNMHERWKHHKGGEQPGAVQPQAG